MSSKKKSQPKRPAQGRQNTEPLISRIDRHFDALPPQTEYIVWGIYIVLLIIVSVFHEPWGDEAQAWLIARDATLHDILFVLPPNEGHPPLWHLYLMLFARSGLPYEFGLKSAAILLNAAAMFLFLKKAPFKREFKFAVPFTYFFFYQYGVIARCYSLTLLGFILLCCCWQKKNEKPFLTAGSMFIICGSSVYGIMLCFGICLIWCIQILREKRKFAALLKDKRIYALLLLSVFAFYFSYIVLHNTFFSDLIGFSQIAKKLWYMLIAAPLDALFTDSYSGDAVIQYMAPTVGQLILPTIIFIPFAYTVFRYARFKRNTALLIVPYLIYALASATGYFNTHHLGVFTVFFVFWLWDCALKKSEGSFIEYLLPKLSSDKSKAVRTAAACTAVLCILTCVPIGWSAVSAGEDIAYNYDCGRKTADYLKDTGLDGCERILIGWKLSGSIAEGGVEQGKAAMYLLQENNLIRFEPYFDRNICYAFNGGEDRSYVTTKYYTSEEAEAAVSAIASQGLPDVILSGDELNCPLCPKVSKADYSPVKKIDYAAIFKGRLDKSDITIWVRNDLLSKYGLTPIKKS